MPGVDHGHRSGSDQLSNEVAGGRGNIRAVRGGINPNSSGHGVLWAGLFFLPHSLVSALMQGSMAHLLAHALERYREGGTEGATGFRGLAPVWWTLAWVLSASAWITLLAVLGWPVPLLVGIAGLVVSGLAYLTYRRRSSAWLKLATWHSVKMSVWLLPLLVILALAFPAALLVMMPVPALFLAGSVAKARAGWSVGRLLGLGLLYAAVGALLLLPLPYPPGNYNPVGLYFPIWGFIGPAALAAWLLWDDGGSGEGGHAET